METSTPRIFFVFKSSFPKRMITLELEAAWRIQKQSTWEALLCRFERFTRDQSFQVLWIVTYNGTWWYVLSRIPLITLIHPSIVFFCEVCNLQLFCWSNSLVFEQQKLQTLFISIVISKFMPVWTVWYYGLLRNSLQVSNDSLLHSVILLSPFHSF